MTRWRENRWAYLSLVLALVVPDMAPYTFPRDEEIPGDLNNWEDSELTLLIEEGRRQLDRQAKNTDTLRSRSQWLFTTGLAVLAVVIGSAGPFELRWPNLEDIFVFVGLASTIYAVLGSAALMVVPVRSGVIDVGDLSRRTKTSNTGSPSQEQSILAQLAQEYAAAIQPGEATWQTRLTVFFEVAIWLLIAAAFTGMVYLFH